MVNLMKVFVLIPGLLFSVQAFAQGAQSSDCTQLIESVRLPTDGKSISSENTLDGRVFYKIIVRGTYEKEDIGSGDAQYAFNSKQDNAYNRCGNSMNGLLFGVELNTGVGEPKSPDWGPFNPKHVYTLEIVGRDKKLGLRFQDCRVLVNKGSLMVDIFKCNRREPIR